MLIARFVFELFVLLLLLYVVACAAVELVPVPLLVISRYSSCPKHIAYICSSRESFSDVIWWRVNGDLVASSTISTNSTYPVPLEVSERFIVQGGVSVSVDSVQMNGGGSYMWSSSLSLTLLPGKLAANTYISCGDGITTNTSTLRCQLPQGQYLYAHGVPLRNRSSTKLDRVCSIIHYVSLFGMFAIVLE